MAKNKIAGGLRLKPNDVYERAEVINGKRRWFSSLDPKKYGENVTLLWAKQKMSKLKKITAHCLAPSQTHMKNVCVI